MSPWEHRKILETGELLRLEFLSRELELIKTLILAARVGLGGELDPAHAHQAMSYARKGLDTVRKLVDRLSSPDEQARILQRLEQLEAELHETATEVNRIAGNLTVS